jgi:hypothetical protein
MADLLEETGFEEAFKNALNGTVAEEVVTDPPVSEPPPVVEPPVIVTLLQKTEFNPSEYLKTASEGFLDSEDKFKSYIPKIKNYDDLETKLKDLESKVPVFKNDETKALYEAWADGNKEAVINYIKESTKDYKTMSDIDVVRESLAKKNPQWSAKDVELELRAEYGKQLETIDLADIDKEDENGRTTQEYKDALSHNERVEENLLRLQRAARDGRISLIDNQSKIELPQINKAEAPAAVTNAPTDEEIAERTAAWVKSVDERLPELKGIKQTIDDKEVEYSFTDAEKVEMAAEMKNFNIFNFAKDRGWYNEDGTTNVLKLAEDVQKLTKFDTITKSFATQVKTDATKDALKKIKNIDKNERPPSDESPQSLEEAFMLAKYGAAK